MLRPRIGAGLFLKNGTVVQSIGFNRYLPVGKPEIAVEYLNRWGIDEIVVLDLDATRNGTTFSPNLLKLFSAKCFTPMAIGGGISNLKQIESLLKSGADKVSLNSSFRKNPKFVTEAAKAFGQQCIVVSIDAIRTRDGKYAIYDYIGSNNEGSLIEWVKKAEDAGTGEILVQSVDQDGKRTGFEIPLYQTLSKQVKVPLLAMGGAGTPAHFQELLTKAQVQAAFAGNFFHYTEHSVMIAKGTLVQAGIPVRTRADIDYYGNVSLDSNARVARKGDAELDELLFSKTPVDTL